MSRSWADLPRDWMVADLAVLRADQMKRMVAQAVEFGFDEPADLTNQLKRHKWLRECREKAWDLLAAGEIPAPGKPQPADAKPDRRKPRRPTPKRRAAPTPASTASTPPTPPQDVFPPGGNRRRKPTPRRKVEADLCEITAAEANEFLRSLPDPEDT